jgi:hypothetical protein
LSFVFRSIVTGDPLEMPAGNASVLFLVTVAPKHGSGHVMLPHAAAATSRMLIIRRLDSRALVVVRAPAGETLVGAGRNGEVRLERRFDQVTVVSDGTGWAVLDAGNAGGTGNER